MLSKGKVKIAVLVFLISIVVFLGVNLRSPRFHSYIETDTLHGDTATGQEDLQNIRQNGLSESLRGVNLSQMNQEQLLLTIHSYLDNTNVLCRRKLRMGKLGDGGWEICDDPDVRPKPLCIIYSFGINYDFSFDDDAARVYGCHVFSFDPSMNSLGDHLERSKLLHFYKFGLSNKNTTNSKNWKLTTFAEIRSMLGHQTTDIDIVKMDIEGSEWESIPEMIKSGQLATVKQLMVEYHVKEDSHSYLLPKLHTIQNVEYAGFSRYYVHKNPACVKPVSGFPVTRTSCYETHYIRRMVNYSNA